MPDQPRRIRSLGVERQGAMYIWDYEEGGGPGDGQFDVDTLYTGFSAGTELTFVKGGNPYLTSRWDGELGVFVEGEASAGYPMPFLGYMEVGRVAESRTPAVQPGTIVGMAYGHKTGHRVNARHEQFTPLPDGLDAVLGIYVGQMGPICANGLLHAAAEAVGPDVRTLGDGVRGRTVLVIGAGVVGLLTALFSRLHGAAEVVVADPDPARRKVVEALGLTAQPDEDIWRYCKERWLHGGADRGADVVFQTRAKSASLHQALRALRPQGAVIDLAFYVEDDGAPHLRLGEEFHHNGLSIRCAQIGRVPRGTAAAWDRARLSRETLDLLAEEGAAIRKHMLTHIVPYDDAPAFIDTLVRDRPDFVQIAFKVYVRDAASPRRILFVFAWLVVGGEETEVRLLAKALDRSKWRIDVVGCFRKANMPEQTHDQLRALGVDVDTTPYALSFDDTVAYLAEKMVGYDVVVACQAVAEVYPALERMTDPPPLIEHGGLVDEALRGPKHLTSRYVGVCDSIRAAAAPRMVDPTHALEIPSMVDLGEFDPADRASVRAEFDVGNDQPLIGWVGRLDRKKRVQDFIEAASIVRVRRPDARFLIIGGPDAFMPDYADELRALAAERGLSGALTFTGDRDDVPRLLAGLDAMAWLARGEGMPHVIAEAGAARLPVVATRDNGTLQQITDGETGLFVPHEDPSAVAAALLRLIDDPTLRRRLGGALRTKVQRDYAVAAVAPQWERLFGAVIADHVRD